MKMECGKLKVIFMEIHLSKSGAHDFQKVLMRIDLITTRCIFLYVIEILLEKLIIAIHLCLGLCHLLVT